MNKLLLKVCFVFLVIFSLITGFAFAEEQISDNERLQDNCSTTCLQNALKIEECSTSGIVEKYIKEDLEAKNK